MLEGMEMASRRYRRLRRSRPAAWDDASAALNSSSQCRRTVLSALVTSSLVMVRHTSTAAAAASRPAGAGSLGTADAQSGAFVQPVADYSRIIQYSNRREFPVATKPKVSTCSTPGSMFPPARQRTFVGYMPTPRSTANDDSNELFAQPEAEPAPEPKPKRGPGRPKGSTKSSGSPASRPTGGRGRGRGRGRGGRQAHTKGAGRGRVDGEISATASIAAGSISTSMLEDSEEGSLQRDIGEGNLQRDIGGASRRMVSLHRGGEEGWGDAFSGDLNPEDDDAEEAEEIGRSELERLGMITVEPEQFQDSSKVIRSGRSSAVNGKSRRQKVFVGQETVEVNGADTVNGVLKVNGAAKAKAAVKDNGENSQNGDSSRLGGGTAVNGESELSYADFDDLESKDVEAAGSVKKKASKRATSNENTGTKKRLRPKSTSARKASTEVNSDGVKVHGAKKVKKIFEEFTDINSGAISERNELDTARDLLIRDAMLREHQRGKQGGLLHEEDEDDDGVYRGTERVKSASELWAEWEEDDQELEKGRKKRKKEDYGSEDEDDEEENRLPTSLELCTRLNELIAEEFSGEGTGTDRATAEYLEHTHTIQEEISNAALKNTELRHVMVVFGKHLIRDQITVEYASRIRRLVQGIKSGRLKPDLVCFTGGRVRDNKVADASAGYIFFRHLCEHQQVDISELRFLVESESTCTKEAMRNVVKDVARLEEEERHELEDEDRRPRMWPRLKYHFTLISNEYHLSRMSLVHRLSPGVSLLAPLKQLDASCGYEHVSYPYACCNDEGTKFQSDVYKTLEELVPLQVNVQAVASREEFFQEENYRSLAHVRGMLTDFIRQLHSSRVPLAMHMHLADLQRAAEQGRRGKKGTLPAGSVANMRLDEALEWAAGALGKIEEIIEPAATRRDSVSLRAWAMCAALLEKAVLQGQMAADPDRPLKAAEWSVLEDDQPEPEPVREVPIFKPSYKPPRSGRNVRKKFGHEPEESPRLEERMHRRDGEAGYTAEVEDDLADGTTITHFRGETAAALAAAEAVRSADNLARKGKADVESELLDLGDEPHLMKLRELFVDYDDDENGHDGNEESPSGGDGVFNPWNREPFVPRSKTKGRQSTKAQLNGQDHDKSSFEFGDGANENHIDDRLLVGGGERGMRAYDEEEDEDEDDDFGAVRLSVLDIPGYEWLRDDDDDDEDDDEQSWQEEHEAQAAEEEQYNSNNEVVNCAPPAAEIAVFEAAGGADEAVARRPRAKKPDGAIRRPNAPSAATKGTASPAKRGRGRPARSAAPVQAAAAVGVSALDLDFDEGIA